EKEELHNLINTLQLCISTLEANHVIKEFNELNIHYIQHQVREVIYDYYQSWHESLSKQKESVSLQEQNRDSELEKCQVKLESDINKLHDNKYDKFKDIYQKECSYKLKNYPLSHPSNKEYFEQLKKLKGYLDIKDEDANRIHNTIVEEIYKNNLNKYQQYFSQKIEQFPYPLSNQIRQELKTLQQSLGLEDEDVKSIEKEIEKKSYEANLQNYKKEFSEIIKQESYPLSSQTFEKLISLQQSLGLKDEDVNRIKKPIEQKAYEKNLQKYRTEFSLRINQEGYPLSNQTREKLKFVQQQLGLKDKDVKAIERIIEEEPYQENLQLYRNQFLQIVKKEAYPFSHKIREELKSRQQSLGLKDGDIKSVEQPILKQAYRNNLQVYGKEFSEKINQASNNLNNINREELKLRQEFLGLTNEADIKLVESIILKFINIDSNLIFRNEQQIDFWELRDLLVAGEWEKADDWTRRNIVQIANRNKEGYLDKKSIKIFPIKDIFTINQIWVIYSKGRFGFSVQKKIFDSVRQSKDDFAKKVGWKETKAFISSWKDYDELRFGIDAPQGHLPAWGVKFNHNFVESTSSFIRTKISGKNSDISNHNIFGDDFSYLFSWFGEDKLENISPENNHQNSISSVSSPEKNIAVTKNNSNEYDYEEQTMNIKNFKVVTLGASGSGKTIFLASLFKKLSIQEDCTFKLVVRDTKQRKLLNSIYTQIICEDTWPPGTKNISEWTFDCCVQTEELEDYTACQFTYFDYAGGRLIDGEDQKFEKVVEQADAILGLLDGRKIHAWLEDGNQILVNEFLDKDLPSILKRIQTSKVPVHFVISKWDLLDRDGYSLSEVKERLLDISEFAELLEARSRLGSPVRLIPISAVGLDFASLQPDGSMKKNPGVKPMPFLVESPLACVLPDKLQQLIKESEAKQEKIEKKAKNRSGNIDNSINYFNPHSAP
ncbi:MAG: GUN4 domain-containing protein, partial [Rivularia sp. ALOHA_DT_140]|nr:GUN4 domain-containing protein [Rivularia sp. ALOHA_DT_140]